MQEGKAGQSPMSTACDIFDAGVLTQFGAFQPPLLLRCPQWFVITVHDRPFSACTRLGEGLAPFTDSLNRPVTDEDTPFFLE